MKPKSLVTLALLAFVAVSVIALIAKELGNKSASTESETPIVVSSTIDDGVIVYYFHGTARCATCRNIEAYTRESIETTFARELSDGSMEFHVIDVEQPDAEHFVEDYQLVSSSVVLARFKDNMQVDWKNLDEVWELVQDKDSFLSYIQDETTAMLQGGS